MDYYDYSENRNGGVIGEASGQYEYKEGDEYLRHVNHFINVAGVISFGSMISKMKFKRPKFRVTKKALATNLIVSSTIEGVASAATGSKYDFFDAGIGMFGAPAYAVLSPTVDFYHDVIITLNNKNAVDVQTEFRVNIIGLKISRVMNRSSIGFGAKANNHKLLSKKLFADLNKTAPNSGWTSYLDSKSLSQAAFNHATISEFNTLMGKSLQFGTINVSDLLFLMLVKNATNQEETDKNK